MKNLILEVGNYAIVEWKHTTYTEYVVCWGYNKSTQSWNSGSYVMTIEDAIAVLHYKLIPTDKPMSYHIHPLRMEEIASTALSYLNDNDMLEDYLEDRCIDLDFGERKYFCIEEESGEY